MVFTPLHWIPSAIAAVLAVAMALSAGRRHHSALARSMLFFAVLGLVGYISAGNFRLTTPDFHTLHSWVGLVALSLSLGLFVQQKLFRRSQAHCRIGRLAAVLAALALLTGLLMLLGLIHQGPGASDLPPREPVVQELTAGKLPEVEATTYIGIELTPLSAQRNNAMRGTQSIDRAKYRLEVTGLVNHELTLSYDELLDLPPYSEVAYMPCVEGWGFTAKWTGFRVVDLLKASGLKPEASYVVFYSADGYSTGIPLDYIESKKILLASGINDVTLPG